jgi:hypothetical protein
LDVFGWQYVSRTAKNAQLCVEGEWFTTPEFKFL